METTPSDRMRSDGNLEMLRLSELKLPLDHGEEALQEAVLKRLRIPPDRLLESDPGEAQH